MAPNKVLKFGGSSVADAGRIMAVARIIQDATKASSVVAVVSAMGGVTDRLLAAAASAVRGERDTLGDLERRHLEAVEMVAREGEWPQLCERVTVLVAEVRDLLRGVQLLGECSARTRDAISGMGERLSAPIVAAALRAIGVDAEPCDARDLIRTDRQFGNAHVDFAVTRERIRTHFERAARLQVVTGFVGSTAAGETTTLGRGGSDYTAAVLGAALDVRVIEIWTDVDGVLSADPRYVASAFSLEELTFDELMELSHFGAKVVYPPTVHPARARGIPIVIRNTLRPEFPGTTITTTAVSVRAIRGISSIHHVALFRLQGDGMVGVPGIAARLFGALAERRINVILITQASSEHSICFAVAPEAVDDAQEAVYDEFRLERTAGLIDDVVIERELSVIAVVGEGMRERPGIAGRLFDVLGQRRINVKAIAQGSSELNISLVVERENERLSLNVIHGAFFLEPVGRVFVVGTGTVGGRVIGQLRDGQRFLAEGRSWPIQLAGTCNRRLMWFADGAETPADLERFVCTAMEAEGRRVVVDVTAGDQLPEWYVPLLEAGVSIVAANKRPFVESTARYEALWAAAERGRSLLCHETTVGAGLPVLHTLREMVETGDRIRTVEGVFSGTAAYLLDQLRQGIPFSNAVRAAFERGLTEPDPREDLSGADVARKLLILARASGFAAELTDVVKNPLGMTMDDGDLDEFWARLSSVDAAMAEQEREARARGGRLTYLARCSRGDLSVGLVPVAQDHPAATMRGTDNVFAFSTDRYAETPLVLIGPGAGPDVTAAGVVADIRRALAHSPL
jgi:aspartokinase/homoserine dehydrogenase 1